MSLVTIERSSSSDNLSQISGELVDSEEDHIDGDLSEDVFARSRTTSSVEGFFASKGAAYSIPDGDFARKASLKGGELQSHLQGMVNLIRDEDTMRLVVKVESEAKYTRYLCIITTYGLSDEEESVVLGFDWINEGVSLGLVIPLWSNVSTELDGDGGFEIKTEHRNYIFKPVSVQTLWTALLWIHKCIKIAHRAKHFNGGLSHAWLDYYRISSPRECVNFWESMDELEIKREIDLSCFEKVKTDEELLKGSIRNKLKEILTRFDLEEVTCRQVREALEAEMKMSLRHLKGYVDEQLFVILGQMESSSKITDHLFLGSEWNACNLQELKDNGVGYILNITKEVDNFFPGTFEYMNIRLYDFKEADLMRHWGKTYRFIQKARERGSSVLVHCRRGISRSASTVIAYLMKESNMSLSDAMKHVKSRRSIVQPNSGFWKQLIIYEGILKSSRNRHSSLFRRRSNSDSCNNRSRPHKKGRHKSTTDHVDNSSEHARTLPRMSNEALPEGDGENVDEEEAGVPPCEAPYDWEEDDPDDSLSSEDSSNSDEETSKTKHKIRRTVSEPVMKIVDDFMMTSPTTRKPRARTFADREANDVVRPPTSISEDNEESDGIDVDRELEEGEIFQVSAQEAEAEISLTDEDLIEDSEVTNDVKRCVMEGNVEANDKTETGDDDTTNTEQLTSSGELEAIEHSCDAPEQVLCEESSRVDFPREEVDSPREDVDSPREDLDSPREDLDSPREESPREGNSDYETSPTPPRQRSRSIGEKLVEKLLVKQGRCENSDNLKKVNVRGRVRRRERKAKSDLQLSSSGFVKRHTQIIEEQMLYSLLNNSDQTLATLATEFWEQSNSVIHKEDFCAAENNTEVEMDLSDLGISVTESETDSEKYVNVSEKSSENFVKHSDEDYAKPNECSSDKNDEHSFEKMDEKCLHSENTCEKPSTQTLDQNSENNSENCCDRKRAVRSASAELQTIVQEVNAETKRDIETQGDVTMAPVVSQTELRGDVCDDICIDQMTWIDLTHHHGDVVKRRSAAFENVSAQAEPLKQGTGASSQQTVVVARNDHTQNTCQDDMSDNTKSQTPSTNMDVPKLHLDDLENGDSSLMRTNSIIVDDYNSWECSSVRDRTKILENIIAKTGGSFPSPRSRVAQSEVSDSEAKLEQGMSELDINTRPQPEVHSQSLGTTSEQPGEDDVFGDAPVRSLVDKFEKNGSSE